MAESLDESKDLSLMVPSGINTLVTEFPGPNSPAQKPQEPEQPADGSKMQT